MLEQLVATCSCLRCFGGDRGSGSDKDAHRRCDLKAEASSGFKQLQVFKQLQSTSSSFKQFQAVSIIVKLPRAASSNFKELQAASASCNIVAHRCVSNGVPRFYVRE
eukprot:2770587-Alexandrium_andersonii.AAC.1